MTLCFVCSGKQDLAFFSDRFVIKTTRTDVVVPFNAVQNIIVSMGNYLLVAKISPEFAALMYYSCFYFCYSLLQILDAIPKDTKGRVLLHFHLNNKTTKVMNGKKELTAIVIQVLATQELSIDHPTLKGQRLEGPAAVVLCQAFGAALSPAEVFAVPDADTFTSFDGHSGIGAYVKASGGFLFPVPAGLCFLETPASFIPKAAIASVELARANGASSTFDLYVHCKDGSIREFSQISRCEVPAIERYIRSTGLAMGAPIESEDEGDGGSKGGDVGGSDSDSDDPEDEDFNPEKRSDKSDGGRKRKRQKTVAAKEGAEAGNKVNNEEQGADGDMKDGEEEEEYEGSDSESDSGSGSGSDSDDSDSDDGSVEIVSEDEFSMGQLRDMMKGGKEEKSKE